MADRKLEAGQVWGGCTVYGLKLHAARSKWAESSLCGIEIWDIEPMGASHIGCKRCRKVQDRERAERLAN